ncbi:hypothetical protein A8H26_01465 [Pluralibacter gergoviae]|nr:hypothetical protein A8H26_01465 [Pluralibacter gergoviae]MBL3691461.1 hypothetical protein [Pluralibacter gergoviae]PHH44787.1 hypothetical protein CRX51_02795 [Pluralibacter gergoviae]
MLEYRRHKVKPCLPDCVEVYALTEIACLCKISEFSFNHLFRVTGRASSGFTEKICHNLLTQAYQQVSPAGAILRSFH